MLDNFKVPAVKNAKKNHDSEIKLLCKQERILDSERRKAKCDNCFLNYDYLDLPLEERYSKCTCKNSKNVSDEYQKYIALFDSIENYKKIYAKEIFNILKTIKPKLYSKASKKNVEWDEEFPEDFEKVPKLLYSAIIALAEETTGRYIIIK